MWANAILGASFMTDSPRAVTSLTSATPATRWEDGRRSNVHIHLRAGERTRARPAGGMRRWAAVGYSTTRSARSNSDRGIVRPSALAVLRLSASSYLVGCTTGRSAGLAPFRILSVKLATLSYTSASEAA